MSRFILKQSSKIGFLALISRVIAFMREFLLIRFLGISDQSDIFFTAFRIPNTLRKIFAEGALSSVLIPALINAEHKGGKTGLSRLTTLSCIIIESIILLFCLIIFFNATQTIALIVPGFSSQKIIECAHLLKILISFILFTSSSAIFASSLQSQHKFFIPAIAPFILNVLYVGSLLLCLYFKLSIATFSYFMAISSALLLLIHIATYLAESFSFNLPNVNTFKEFQTILIQLVPCILSVGIMEINHFINTSYGSYLPGGSLTLLRNAYQFVNIPIGIITASLVTVLLPHFSKLRLQQPEELGSHLLEAIKFVIWTTMPICFLLGFFSGEIFQTLFFGDPTAINKVFIAKSIFAAYLAGLLSFSLNKVLLSVLYALRLTKIPLIATFISIAINVFLTRIFMVSYGVAGIALASSIASTAQTLFFLLFLHAYLKLRWPQHQAIKFLTAASSQLILFCSLFWAAYRAGYAIIMSIDISWNLYFITIDTPFLINSIGVWLWCGPLSLLFLGAIFLTRNLFGIQLNYFNH